MTTKKAVLSEMTTCNPTSLYDFFTNREFVNSVDKFTCVRTAILRYYLTAVTGKRIRGERLNKETTKKQIQKLKNIKVDSSFNINAHLELIKKGGEMYGKSTNQTKSDVSYGKRFFAFVRDSVVPIPQKNKYDKNVILSYTDSIMDKSEWISEKKYTNRKIILSDSPNCYLEELKLKHPDLDNSKLYVKANVNIIRFFKIFDDYEKYRSNKCREATHRKSLKKLLRFIGWFKEYKKISIDDLSIDKIFPVISPYIEYREHDNFNDDNFITEIAKKEWYRKREVKNKSKEFIAIVNTFLDEYLDKSTVTTKVAYIQALINFSSFLYKKITDTEENNNFQDISLINRLHVCMRDLGKIKNVEPEKIIPFNWQEIKMVCERLRREANQDYAYSKRNQNHKGRKLTKKEKALHIQDFIAIAFFCVMPPDRQRTFRELTLGKTLKYGIRDIKRNTFTSYENIKEGEKPKYYIHLLPHQYKTGDTYGTYWHEINDVEYGDGKKFYDYLSQWFFEGYREELATEKETNAVFIRAAKGVDFMEDEEQNEVNFGAFIKSIFKRKTKFPLNPHALRDIYVTYINNLNLSEEIRRAIAYMMHHDLETADKIYNRQTSDEKIALGVDFIKQDREQSLTPEIFISHNSLEASLMAS